jgi:hypothetical protein
MRNSLADMGYPQRFASGSLNSRVAGMSHPGRAKKLKAFAGSKPTLNAFALNSVLRKVQSHGVCGGRRSRASQRVGGSTRDGQEEG